MLGTGYKWQYVSSNFQRQSIRLTDVATAGGNVEGSTQWVPTAEWVRSWKSKLPLQNIMRLLQILVPQVEKICIDKYVEIKLAAFVIQLYYTIWFTFLNYIFSLLGISQMKVKYWNFFNMVRLLVSYQSLIRFSFVNIKPMQVPLHGCELICGELFISGNKSH